VKDTATEETSRTQATGYLGENIRKDKGFKGTVYLAKDRSEMRFHATKCCHIQILREFGLRYTAAAACMGDHVTCGTVFPNVIFKRSHAISVGDEFCDHEFRVRSEVDPKADESSHGDAHRIDGL
jgi:hypothetical protein